MHVLCTLLALMPNKHTLVIEHDSVSLVIEHDSVSLVIEHDSASLVIEHDSVSLVIEHDSVSLVIEHDSDNVSMLLIDLHMCIMEWNKLWSGITTWNIG